nr:unnamed protein product [Callosobruchus chinensis]
MPSAIPTPVMPRASMSPEGVMLCTVATPWSTLMEANAQ